MTARRRTTALLVATVLSLGSIGAACGDDDDDDDDGGESLSEEAFLAAADDICVAGDAELDEAATEAFGESEQPDADAFEAFYEDVVAPNLRQQFDDIRALEGPADVEADVDALLEDAEARVDELVAMSGDELLDMAMTGEDPFAEINEQAAALGLTECGSGGE